MISVIRSASEAPYQVTFKPERTITIMDFISVAANGDLNKPGKNGGAVQVTLKPDGQGSVRSAIVAGATEFTKEVTIKGVTALRILAPADGSVFVTMRDSSRRSSRARFRLRREGNLTRSDGSPVGIGTQIR